MRILTPVVSWVAVAQAWPYGKVRTWHVHPGGTTIEQTINAASPGDRIFVEPGTYPERLVITKSGISIIGRNAILVPPATTNPSPCSDFCGPGTNAGICIAGKGIKADDFVAEHQKIRSVKSPVENVLVQGMYIKSFQVNSSVLVIGGRNVRFQGNKIDGGANSIYGFLSAGSVDTVLSDNVITGLADPNSFSFVAACNDNFKGTEVYGNDVSAYFIGFCVQTSGAHFYDNRVKGTCAGAFVDPYVANVKFENNTISDSYTACGGFGGWGVYVSGAVGSRITENKIERITNSNGPSAGVAVEDDACTETSLACASNGNKPSVARDTKVSRNVFKENTLDLLLDSKGSGNVFWGNKCMTSSPAGLCQKKGGY